MYLPVAYLPVAVRYNAYTSVRARVRRVFARKPRSPPLKAETWERRVIINNNNNDDVRSTPCAGAARRIEIHRVRVYTYYT